MATIDLATRTIQRGNFDHMYSADCFVNPESYDFHSRTWNGHNPQAYVILNAGYVAAIVFPEYYAYSEQDALDEAADSGKLDFLQVTEKELADYETGKDSEGYPEYEGIINLGNASEPFDQQNLDYFMVPVSLFRNDPIILDAIAESSRDEAVETLQDFCQPKHEDVTLEGYDILNHAIDYLRDTARKVLPLNAIKHGM
jgi:hypothetical protein